MKPSRLILILLFALTALTLSACASSGALTASSWPGLSANGESAYLAANQFIYAVDTANGSIRWTYPAGKGDSKKTFFAAPVLTADGQLLISGYDNVLYSLSPETGCFSYTSPSPRDSQQYRITSAT